MQLLTKQTIDRRAWLATWMQDRRRKRQAAQSAPVGPGGIAGCQLWLDASTLLLSDSDPVDFWEDLSGNGRHMISELGLGPEFDSAAFPASVLFNGSTYLVCESPLCPQPFSIIAVGQFSPAFDGGTPRPAVFCGGLATAFYTSEQHNGDLTLYTSGADSRSDPGALTYDIPHTVGVVAADLGVPARLFGNGALAPLSEMFQGNNGDGLNDMFYVGAYNGGLYPMVGNIAELLVYNRALSDGEMGALHALLAAKWEIS